MKSNKYWKNRETELSLQIGQDVYDLCVIHSGHILHKTCGTLPEDSEPEDLEVETHGLAYCYKNSVKMTEKDSKDFSDKYDGLIGDEILSKLLD